MALVGTGWTTINDLTSTGQDVSNALDTAFENIDANKDIIDGYMNDTVFRFEAKSTIDQAPTALDTPMQITIGAAQDTEHVSIDANGTITFKTAGTYSAQIDVMFGRTGASGVSHLTFRSLFNDTQTAPSFLTLLDSADIQIPFNQTGLIPITTAGTTLKFEMYRDSSGNNSGGIYSRTPRS